MNSFKVLIIDDEALARQIIKKFLEDQADIQIAGECENGFDALKMITEVKPDLLFLDVQMPKIDGFELLEVLDEKPEIIFSTAYDQYAIKAFEMNAVDYLLKPFSKDRLLQALEKAKQRLMAKPADAQANLIKIQEQIAEEKEEIDRVITRLGSKIHVIPVEKIHYIESSDDYVMIYSDLGKHLKEKTMRYFEQHLPDRDFIRVHRSHIVNISQILSIELYGKDTHLAILKCGAKIKVSAEGYKRLRERL
ncbi:MAG: LytR/AlgR family response regulator transcription factor [Bacteroidales bacterium]